MFNHLSIHILSLIILFYRVPIVSLYSCHHHNMTTSLFTMFIIIFLSASLLSLMSFLRSSKRFLSKYEFVFSIFKSFSIWKWSMWAFFFPFTFLRKETHVPYIRQIYRACHVRYTQYIVYTIRMIWLILLYDRNYTSKSQFRHESSHITWYRAVPSTSTHQVLRGFLKAFFLNHHYLILLFYSIFSILFFGCFWR